LKPGGWKARRPGSYKVWKLRSGRASQPPGLIATVLFAHMLLL